MKPKIHLEHSTDEFPTEKNQHVRHKPDSRDVELDRLCGITPKVKNEKTVRIPIGLQIFSAFEKISCLKSEFLKPGVYFRNEELKAPL